MSPLPLSDLRLRYAVVSILTQGFDPIGDMLASGSFKAFE
jgi:hypothetical protein